MTINENPRQVKRKRRTIPDGMRLTITEVRGFPRRTRGPDKNLLLKIRRRYIKYIADCPYLNSNEKFVIIKIAEWFNLKDGFTRAAIPTLAESVGVSHATVERAVKTAYDAGLMGIKPGGPSRKGSFGPVANKYVLAFRLVINDANNLLIQNAPYHFLPRTVNGEAKSSPQMSSPQIEGSVDPKNPSVEAESSPQIEGVRDNVIGGAKNAAPSDSADAAATGSATRRERIQLEPLPTDHIKMKMKSDLFFGLAENCLRDGTVGEMDPDRLREIIEGNGEVEFLRTWCAGKAIYNEPPPDGVPFAHVIIYGDRNPMTCEEGDCGEIALHDLKPTGWIAVECRK